MIRISQILFWFGMTIAASLLLFHTSDRVHVLDRQLRDIDARIEDEQKSLHVLKAEWVYLANPARLEASAHKYLVLRPTAPRQIVRLDDLSEALRNPPETVASASPAVASPAASAGASLKSTLAALPARLAASIHRARSVNKVGTIAVASADTGHINERMIIEHAAGAAPGDDAIAALIGTLGARP